jgi:hypothetical protein
MCWRLTRRLIPISRLWRTLAFRLTAGYALAGLVLVIFATASLYFRAGIGIREKYGIIPGRQITRAPHDAGDTWQAIVHDLPAVLSVEAQTLP